MTSEMRKGLDAIDNFIEASLERQRDTYRKIILEALCGPMGRIIPYASHRSVQWYPHGLKGQNAR